MKYFLINILLNAQMARQNNVESSRGFTLLEYTAGAAIILGIIWVALEAMGKNVADLITAISEWAVKRSECIRGGDPANC